MAVNDHPENMWKEAVMAYLRARYQYFMIQGSSVSIVSDYGLDGQGSIPGRVNGFFF
jgi:hypothetical protein